MTKDKIIYAVLGGHNGEPLRRYRLSNKEIASINGISLTEASKL